MNTDFLETPVDDFKKELSQSSVETLSEYEELLNRLIQELRESIEEIENSLSRRVQLVAIWLGAISIFSLILLNQEFNADFIKTYLIFILPYLLVALFILLKSTNTTSYVTTEFSVSIDKSNHILNLRNKALAFQQVYINKLKEHEKLGDKALIARTISFLFAISLLLHIYMFIFWKLPNIFFEEIYLNTALIIYGLYQFQTLKRKRIIIKNNSTRST